MKAITVLIIGDEAIARQGLTHLLSAEGGLEVEGETASEGALKQAGELKPEVVIVFAEAIRPSCVRLVSSLREKIPQAGIVVLGHEIHHAYVGLLLTAGALGYVLLRALPRTLFSAIRAASRGHRFVDPDLGDQLYELLAQQAESGTKLLSPREQQVLTMTAYGHTLKEIAARLDISQKSIETYQARVRTKLGLRTRVDVIRYALETQVLAIPAVAAVQNFRLYERAEIFGSELQRRPTNLRQTKRVLEQSGEAPTTVP